MKVQTEVPHETASRKGLDVIYYRDVLKERKFASCLVATSLALFFTPLLIWTGIFTNRMNLGGDNSLLYFPFPVQWIEHYGISSVSANLSGYSASPQYLPIAAMSLFLKIAHINAEGAFLGLVLAGLFSGTVMLSREIIVSTLHNDNVATKIGAFFAGTVAISGPLLSETQWTSLLPGIGWEALLPWLLYLFLRHQIQPGVRHLIWASSLSILGSAAISDAPNTIGSTVAIVVLLTALFLAKIWKPNCRRLIEFMATLGITQLFWAIPFILGFSYNQGAIAVSTGAKSTATSIITALAPLQSGLDALELRQSTPMMQAYGWTQLSVSHGSRSLGFLGLIPWIVVVGALITTLISRTTNHSTKRILFLLASASLVALCFFYPNLPGIRDRLDILLTKQLPGWTAERNFYTTLGLGYLVILSITAGIALAILISTIRSRIWSRLTAAVVLVALPIYNAPFFKGAYFNMPITQNGSITRVLSDGLPHSYLSLISRLNKLPSGGVLSLPLLNPAWTVVSNKSLKGHGVYLGISPVFALTGRSDYNGIHALDNSIHPNLPQYISELLNEGKTTEVADILHGLGVRYVILNTANLSPIHPERFNAVASPILEQRETAELASLVAPHVIERSGSYELRAENNNSGSLLSIVNSANEGKISSSPTVYPKGVGESIKACGNWSQTTSSSPPWKIIDHIRSSKGTQSLAGCTILLRNIYSPGWSASIQANGKLWRLHPESQAAQGYFVAFKLPSVNTASAQVELTYTPQSDVWRSIAASVLGISLVLFLYSRSSRRTRMIGLNNLSHEDVLNIPKRSKLHGLLSSVHFTSGKMRP